MNKDEFLSAYKVYGDDMIIEIIDIFLKDYPEKMSALNEAIQNKDFKKIDSYSHSLKGSLGVFTAGKERDTAYSLEQAGKNKDASNLENLFMQLQQHLTNLSEELNNIKIELSSSSN